MTGREDKKANDLFFTCSLIEYMARKTKNKCSAVVDALGRTQIEKIYDQLANDCNKNCFKLSTQSQ